MTLKPGRAVPPFPPHPPRVLGQMGMGPPDSREALEAQTPLASSITFQPNCARCCSIHRAKPSRDPSPIPGWNLSGGCRISTSKGPSENGKKERVEPDPWKNCRGGMLSLRPPAPWRGLRCFAVGAAPPEPLRSLSAPDAIARQQLPVHLQFYP